MESTKLSAVLIRKEIEKQITDAARKGKIISVEQSLSLGKLSKLMATEKILPNSHQ